MMLEDTRRRAISVLAAIGVSAGAVIFASSMEGRELKAYPDPGKGWALPTICDGHTRGVKRGDVATPAQCDAYMAEDMKEAAKPLARCIKPKLSRGEFDQVVDFNFNTGAACSSAPVAAINAGKSCDEIADAFFVKAPIQMVCVKRDPETGVCYMRVPNIYQGDKPVLDFNGSLLLVPGQPIKQFTTGGLKPFRGLMIRRKREGERYREACKAADAEERGGA